jgi:DsbC/DsbD-like thiol-disulfide interchange protein
MRKLSLLIVVLMLSVGANAQIETPVRWAQGSKRINATETMVLLRARIQPGWHIYSQNVKEGGPIKTSFTFTPSKTYTLAGKTIEPTPKTKYEEGFKMNVGYFEKEVVFQQKIRIKSTSSTEVKGVLEYAVCNKIGCLPPEELAFNIPIK